MSPSGADDLEEVGARSGRGSRFGGARLAVVLLALVPVLVVAVLVLAGRDGDLVDAQISRRPGEGADARVEGAWPTTTVTTSAAAAAAAAAAPSSTTSTTTTTAPPTTAAPTTAPPTTAPTTAAPPTTAPPPVPPPTVPPATAPPTTAPTTSAPPVVTAPPPTSTTAAPTEPPGSPRIDDGLLLASPLPWSTSFPVADAVVGSVALHSSPGVPVASGRVLENPTFEGLSLVFLIRDRQPGWLLVQFMGRPNSAMAWIKASDVTERTVPHHIVIERGARRLTLYSGSDVLFETAVATGKASSPTPLGSFFVDGIRRLSPPHQSYGTGQLSFTGFSEVYETFGGGVGQVAMHGTQNPALIGTPASNGCVRMTNADIDHMIELSPTGTPVEVVA